MVIIILYNQYKYYTKIIVQNTWKTLFDQCMLLNIFVKRSTVLSLN